MKQYEQQLINELKQYNIELTQAQLAQFKTYADLLIEWNQKMNLTAIVELEDIYSKHFLDCIRPSFNVEIKGHLCDVGAGAGFPSIPLKIVYPQLQVTICEPLTKRCTFLNVLVKELGLDNVWIANERAEDFTKKKRESFDVVSARAVANLVMLSELCIPLVKKNGIFLAMKGSSAENELTQANHAIRLLGCKFEQKDEYVIDDATRINFVFRKVKQTPMRFPRMFSKIKKEPLVGRTTNETVKND